MAAYQSMLEMENDSLFRSLSWEEQVEARKTLASRLIQSDPASSQLSGDQFNTIVQQLAYSPPKFVDRSIDQQATLLEKGWWAERDAAINKKVYGPATRTVMNSVFSDALVDSFATPRAAYSMWAGSRGFIAQAAQGKLKTGVDAVDQVLNTVLRSTATVLDRVLPKGPDRGSVEQNTIWGDDGRKLRDYTRWLMTSDPQRIPSPFAQKAGMFVGTALGMAGDLAIVSSLTGGGVTKSIVGAAEKLLDRAAATMVAASTGHTISRTALKVATAMGLPQLEHLGASSGAVYTAAALGMAAKTIVPTVVETGMRGTILALRGQLQDYLSKPEGDRPKWIPAMDRVANDFGQGIWISLAVGMAGRLVLPFMGAVGKVLFNRIPNVEKTIRKMDLKRLEEASTGLFTGRDLPPEVVSGLPAVLRDHFEQVQVVVDSIGKAQGSLKFNPVIRTHLASMVAGLTARAIGNGQWSFRNIMDAKFLELQPDIASAAVSIQKAQDAIIDGLKPQMREQFLAQRARGGDFTITAIETPMRQYKGDFSIEHYKKDLPGRLKSVVDAGSYVDSADRRAINSNEADFLLPRIQGETNAGLYKLDISQVDREALVAGHDVLSEQGRKLTSGTLLRDTVKAAPKGSAQTLGKMDYNASRAELAKQVKVATRTNALTEDILVTLGLPKKGTGEVKINMSGDQLRAEIARSITDSEMRKVNWTKSPDEFLTSEGFAPEEIAKWHDRIAAKADKAAIQVEGYIRSASAGIEDVSVAGPKSQPIIAHKVMAADADALIITNKIAMPDTVAKTTFDAQRVKARYDLPDSVEDVRRYLLLQSGYDAMSLDTQGSRLQFLLPSDQIKLIDNRIDAATGQISKIYKSKTGPVTQSLDPLADVRVAFQGTIPREMLSERALAYMMQGVTGKVDPSKLKDFVRMYSDSSGAPIGKFTVITDDALNKGMQVMSSKRGSVTVISVPSEVYSSEARRAVVGHFMEILNKEARQITPTVIPLIPSASRFATAYNKTLSRYKLEGADVVEQRKWLEASMKERGAEIKFDDRAKEYTVRIPDQKRLERFKTSEEALDAWVLYNMNERQLRMALNEEGYKLLRQDDPFVKGKQSLQVLDAKGKAVDGWQGDNVVEILHHMNWRPAKLPSTLGPRIVILDPNALEIRYEKGLVFGNLPQVMGRLNNFADYQRRELSTLLNVYDGATVRKFNAQFDVYIPQIGERKTFQSLEEATRFADGEWRNANNLLFAAEKRGFSLAFTNGKYHLTGANGTTVYDTLADLGKKIATIPDPEFQPDIITSLAGDPENVIPTIEGMASAFAVPEHTIPLYVHAPDISNVSPKFSRAKWFAMPKMEWFRNELRKTGHIEMLDDFEELDKAVTLARSDWYEGEQLIEAAWNPSPARGGKRFQFGKQAVPDDRRILISDYIESTDKTAFLNEHPLTQSELQIANWTQTRYVEMFVKGGMAGATYLQNYLPRLRNDLVIFLRTIQGKQLVEAGSAYKMMKPFFEGRVIPKEIDFFARHMRSADFADLILDRDALSLVRKYNKELHKQLYVEPILQRIQARFEANPAAYPTGLNQQFELWRDQILGVDKTHAEMFLSNTTNKFVTSLMDAVKKLPEGTELILDPKVVKEFRKAAHGATNLLFNASYLAFMGWRPWLPYRNMHQVFSTLAPYFGITTVMQAMINVNKYTDKEWTFLRRGAFITEAPPIDDITTGAGFLRDKLMESGLSTFKSSDDWSRAIGYETAKIKFQGAMEAAKKGIVKVPLDILRYAEADRIVPNLFRKAEAELSAGRVDACFDTFSREVCNLANFRYRATGKAGWNRGIVGRLFGKFSTYALGYVQNVIQGFKNPYLNRTAEELVGKGFAGVVPSSLRAIGYGMRLVGFSFAMYKFYESLGIKGNDFLPWAPMQWAGGPEITLALNVLRSTQTNYTGRQARSELDRYLPANFFQAMTRLSRGEDPGWKLQVPGGFIPGSAQLQKLVNAVEALDEGKVHEAVINILGASVSPNLQDSW